MLLLARQELMMMMIKILNQGTQLTKAVFSGSLKEEKGEKICWFFLSYSKYLLFEQQVFLE